MISQVFLVEDVFFYSESLRFDTASDDLGLLEVICS